MTFYQALDFHEGEKFMHKKLHVPDNDNPSMPTLSPQAANMLQKAPLLAFGTLDREGRPWTTVWGGRAGFSQPVGNSMIGIRTPVAVELDPVVEALVGTNVKGVIAREEGEGRSLSGLAIDLGTRKRVKIAGRMVAGSLDGIESEVGDGSSTHQGILQLIVHITESLGNCPKYLNKRDVTPALTHPILLSDSVALDQRAVDLIEKADLMFLSTSRPKHSMDTNHRGGPPGFIRCLPSKDGPTQFVYPEYSGNRLYQSLGNMVLDSKAGFCFPDFETGDCLYVTGTAEILFGKDAAELMPRSNLVVRVTVTAIRLVASVLPFRGRTGEYSPYNPVIRYLACEQKQTRASKVDQHQNTAKLLEQVQLSPTISRFRFSLSNAATYTAGQYVTIDASEHLDFGYSHMRDDDPRSLNDDFVRTFTVSSPPGLPPHPSKSLADDEFEMTIRNVGVVTGLLFKHGLGGRERQADFEVSIKGFGGSFVVEQDKKAPVVAFIAAGVGITPLMPCLPCLRFESLRLIWTIRVADVGLAIDLLDRHQDLAQSLTLFITGEASASNKKNDALERIKKSAVRIEYRRLDQTDIESLRSEVQRWYVCTGASQRNALLQWLSGEEVVYEDYNF